MLERIRTMDREMRAACVKAALADLVECVKARGASINPTFASGMYANYPWYDVERERPGRNRRDRRPTGGKEGIGREYLQEMDAHEMPARARPHSFRGTRGLHSLDGEYWDGSGWSVPRANVRESYRRRF
jgi:hypothetical protein